MSDCWICVESGCRCEEIAALEAKLLSVEMEKEKLRLALEETITCCLDARNEPIEPHYSIGLKALEAVPSDPSLLLAVVEAAKKIVARAEKIDGPVEVHELFLALSAFEASRK